MSQPATEQAPEAAQPAEVEPVVTAEPAGNAAAEVGDSANLDLANLPDDLSPDQIRHFLYQGGELELPDAKKPDPEPEAVKAPEEKAGEPLAKVEAPDDLDDPIKGRISAQQFEPEAHRAMRMQRALNEGKKPGDPGFVSLRECLTKLDEMAPGQAKTPPAAAEPSPVETVKSAIDDLTANLTTLKQQKAEAIQNGEDATEFEDRIDAAKDAISEAKIEFALAKERAQSQQAQQAATQRNADLAARNKAQDAVAKQFPAARDKTQPLGAEIAAVIAELNDPSHPDHSVLHRMSAAKDVTNRALDRLAEREGTTLSEQISKYEAKPAAPVAPEPPPAPKPAASAARKVLPASGAATTTPPKGEPSNADILNQVGDDPDAARDALYGNRKIHYL